MASRCWSARQAIASRQAGTPHSTALGDARALPNRALIHVVPALPLLLPFSRVPLLVNKVEEYQKGSRSSTPASDIRILTFDFFSGLPILKDLK